MNKRFEHNQSAHCENGAVLNLLRFHGLTLSEPMIFGIGSGLFFTFLPFVKVNGLPGSSYRILPGWIFKRVTRRLGVTMRSRTFRDQDRAMAELDNVLAKGLPAGVLTSVFYLPYLPKALRFHFNAHNIVVYGKVNDMYLVSDPVLDKVAEISYDDLKRARFAKGTLAPKGKMYYPVHIPENIDIKPAIVTGIRKTASDMVGVPLPFFGIRGIRYMSATIRKWPRTVSQKELILRLGQLIRMQEEIGTGGAGFRFIFAAFLQEASEALNQDWLREVSVEMTDIGDRWRDFAFEAGRICKGREAEDSSIEKLADILLECADREEKIFKRLKKIQL